MNIKTVGVVTALMVGSFVAGFRLSTTMIKLALEKEIEEYNNPVKRDERLKRRMSEAGFRLYKSEKDSYRRRNLK